MTIIHKESLHQRAEQLESKSLNGMKLLLVKELKPVDTPPRAVFEVYFNNNKEIASFITGDSSVAQSLFSISGGHRIFGGSDTDEVKVVEIQGNSQDDTGLILTVTPIGDYSTYTLQLKHSKIDPLFSRINFKFRPGCFNIDCASPWKSAPAPKSEPVIDYLAKDYDSFKHTLINAMRIR
ncbi:hypothetical protein KA005_81455, partial [bacterium]|nr:hypothetical protein [bacterium]